MSEFADRELNKIADGLDTLQVEVVNELPYIGIEAFKAMFKEIHNPQYRPHIIAKWIELAGSPIGEVKIVDADNKIMFVMPGIISPDLKSTSDLVDQLEFTFVEAEQMNGNFAGSGDAKLSSFMREIIKHGRTPTEVWERVLTEVLPKQASEEVVVEEEEDDFSYFE